MRDENEKYEIIYVMKYALTFGIVKARATIDSSGYACLDDNGYRFFGRYTFPKSQYVKTEQEAEAEFQKMVLKKQALLQKQIKRLELKATAGPVWKSSIDPKEEQ